MVPHIIGVDEVGVGPCAGPVVAAAVVWPEDGFRKGLGDSKKLSAKRRGLMAPVIEEEAPYWAVGFASCAQVDARGVHECRFAVMTELAQECRRSLGVELPVIVDGDVSLRIGGCTAVVKGDESVPAVSAASILAKVFRDEYMVLIGKKYPQYGFGQHKGYVTAEHKAALVKYGPCLEHRRSYAPVKSVLLLG